MLVSFEDIRGYGIHAVDGDIGVLRDVLFEDAASAIRYLVVETGGWLLGREVLLAPAAVGAVEPARRVIATALTTRQVKDSPTLDDQQAFSREHEELLHRHYDWAPCSGCRRRRRTTIRSSMRSPPPSSSGGILRCAARARSSATTSRRPMAISATSTTC